MPVDNIAQLSPVTARPAPAAATTEKPVRQELPDTGKVMPPAAESGNIQQAVSRLNDYVQNVRRDLQFRMDENSDRVIVSVVDSESGEIIRQIPSEEVLAVANNLERVQGLIFNQQA